MLSRGRYSVSMSLQYFEEFITEPGNNPEEKAEKGMIRKPELGLAVERAIALRIEKKRTNVLRSGQISIPHLRA